MHHVIMLSVRRDREFDGEIVKIWSKEKFLRVFLTLHYYSVYMHLIQLQEMF